MYLTKIVLDKSKKEIQDAMYDADKMHKLVMSGFSNTDSKTPRNKFNVLYDVTIIKDKLIKEKLFVLIQSSEFPKYERKISNGSIFSSETKSLDALLDTIKTDSEFYIEVLLQPCRKSVDKESKKNKITYIKDDQERMKWLVKSLKTKGCEVFTNESEFISKPSITVKKNDKIQSIKYFPCLFRGKVKITDEILFRKLIIDGLGVGKSYGLGLIKVYRK